MANPPPDLGPVAFVALVPLLWAIAAGLPARRAALLGFAFGLTYYGILLYWLIPFGIIAWLPLVLSQAAYAALFCALLAVLWRWNWPLSSALRAAALWTVIDWVRGVWPIGGFTWGGLGYTQHANGVLLRLASVTGVWGVTFVVALVNALALVGAVTLVRRSGPLWGRRAMATAGLSALFVVGPAAVPLPQANGPRLDVAVIQGSVPLAFASDRLLQTTVVVRNQIALQRRLQGDPPNLSVWPENSLYDDPVANPDLGRPVSEAIASVGVPTLVGGVADAPGGRFYNQALLYSGDGRIVGRYTKNHLVPFGEYIPFHAVFGWTDRYRRGNALLAEGHHLRLFEVNGVRLGTPICFENVFPDLFRRFVANGAEVMVVTTNDSSFLFSPASREHVIMSQVRAVETGRWVVHAAISGQSALVSPDGTVVRRTGLFQDTILRAAVPSSDARTPYVRFGDWFPWLCGVSVLMLLIGAVVTRRADGGGAGGPEMPERGERARAAPAPIAGGGQRALVVLPTYNERPTIARVVAGVLASGEGVDALVVDDSSPDGTAEVVQDLAGEEPERIYVLSRPEKQGLATAYLTGFRWGLERGYDILVEMDSDLSHRPEDLSKILRGAERFDLTIGSRYVPGGHVSNWSRSRVALSKAGNLYARKALRLPVHDATSGFRAYRREVLEALLPGGVHADGYGFQVELAWRALKAGFTVGEVPITFREREHGHSKLSRRIVIEAFFLVGRWGLQDRFARNGRRAPPAHQS